MNDLIKRLDCFLDSYTEYPESIFGPNVTRRQKHVWQRGYQSDRAMMKRLREFGLPELTNEGRAMFHIQPGQQFNEDAGGYLRRRWAFALGFGEFFLRARAEGEG